MGRVRLQIMRSPSQWPMSARSLIVSREGPRPARPSALVTAGQIAPEVLALTGGAIDEDVDGLEPQGAETALVAGLEPSGNLFGRPSFRKTIADESPQFLIFLEDGFTLPAQLIGSGGVKRRITPARENHYYPAAFEGAAGLISIVLTLFATSAGFLMLRWRTSLSKCASTAPPSGLKGRDIER